MYIYRTLKDFIHITGYMCTTYIYLSSQQHKSFNFLSLAHSRFLLIRKISGSGSNFSFFTFLVATSSSFFILFNSKAEKGKRSRKKERKREFLKEPSFHLLPYSSFCFVLRSEKAAKREKEKKKGAMRCLRPGHVMKWIHYIT